MYICAYVERKREFVRLTVRNCTKKVNTFEVEIKPSTVTTLKCLKD